MYSMYTGQVLVGRRYGPWLMVRLDTSPTCYTLVVEKGKGEVQVYQG